MENKTDVFDLSWTTLTADMLGPLLDALDVNQSVKSVDLSGFSLGTHPDFDTLLCLYMTFSFQVSNIL